MLGQQPEREGSGILLLWHGLLCPRKIPGSFKTQPDFSGPSFCFTPTALLQHCLRYLCQGPKQEKIFTNQASNRHLLVEVNAHERVSLPCAAHLCHQVKHRPNRIIWPGQQPAFCSTTSHTNTASKHRAKQVGILPVSFLAILPACPSTAHQLKSGSWGLEGWR